MNKNEIETILGGVLPRESPPFDKPTNEHWRRLEAKFQTSFPEDFVLFYELMTGFSFPGDILNIQPEGKTNGNDDIGFVYDLEMRSENWDSQMIPFYSIGNGDYFCLSSKEGKDSKVYYRYHEDGRYEPYSSSFTEWIKDLPEFLR
jgi:hypothetical protein